MSKSYIVMIGPSLRSLGGISSVVNVYQRAGLFERWPIRYLSTYRDGSFCVKIVAAIRGFFRYLMLLLQGKVAMLHVHSASRWAFRRKSLFVLVTAVFRKPVVFHLHGGEFVAVYQTELGRFSRAYVRFTLRQCTEIVVLSDRWKMMLAKITGDVPIRAIMNPIDLSNVVAVDNRTRQTGRLLFLGSLGAQKGIHVLLEAVSKLDRSLNWELQIGGNGDLASIEREIRKLGLLNQTHLLGWVDGERKTELLASAVVLILPSFVEGLPMSVLEAMAHGTAVITTPVGGIPDLIDDGVDGLLVPPGDPRELAKAITSLLEDPDFALRLGAAGRKKFQTHFSADVVLPEVDALYDDMGMHRVAGHDGGACGTLS